MINKLSHSEKLYNVPQDVAPNKTSNISHRLQQLFKRCVGSHPHTSELDYPHIYLDNRKKQCKGGEKKRERAHSTRGTCTLIISI